MKKVSFGSFPLTEVKKEDRKCLDRYLIKTFSDNISISDAIRNLAITKNLMYITPDALMRDWIGSKKPRENKGDRESNSMYEGALKRAFHVLREFYSTVSTSPFYKEYVYYPIYVEKVEKVTAEGSDTYDAKYTEVTMNYSFIILSNDLTKNLKIDEIRYDQNASLNFLFLFIEFFSSGDMKQSIHDFKQEDYEFLVRLYQFTEKSNKEPIQMVLDLYKIIALIQKIKDVRTPRDKTALVAEMDKFLGGIEIDSLKKYQGLLRHQFLGMIKKKTADGKSLRKAFTDLMNSIFKSDGLSKLYDGVDTSATRGERFRYVYQSNKYREVLNLAKELVKYNEIQCQHVVTDDSLEIDFRVESNDRSLDLKSGMAAQKYQTFFRDYVDSIKDFFNGMVTKLIDNLDIDNSASATFGKMLTKANSQRRTIESNLGSAENALVNAVNAVNIANANSAAGRGPAPTRDQHTAITNAQNRIDILETELQQQQNFIAVLENQKSSIPSFTKTINDDVAREMTDHLVSSMVTNLTFVYDDGKRFFTNELVAQGLVDLAATDKNRPVGAPANYDLTEIDEFPKAATDAAKDNIFPHYVPGSNNTKDNPAYFAATIASSLEDAFLIMAKDTMVTFEDHILPILQKHYQTHLQKIIVPPTKVDKKPKGFNIFNSTSKESINQDRAEQQVTMVADLLERIQTNSSTTSLMLQKLENELHEKVFRNRFINKVLKNFLRLFEVKDITQVIEYDKQNSQLHPLIKKLLKDGTRCQFFKSFIIDHAMVEQLYRLKHITDTQKFLDGIIDQPPRKFNDPMNRMQTVLHDYLGLQRNPTWVISDTNMYLSMPDDLSLTNTSILSNIPKVDLMQVCRIDPKDYWREEKMGEVAKFGNPKVKKLTTDISKMHEEIKKIREEMREEGNVQTFGESVTYQIEANAERAGLLEEANKNNKNNNRKNNKNNNSKNSKNSKNKNNKSKSNWNNKKDNRYQQQMKRIKDIEKQIDRKEEEIQRAMTDFQEKEFLPNMSIFDDPNRAENQEFLSDQERGELIGNRNKMEEKLRELNPYDDEDVREMEANQRNIDAYREREERSHPFDFEEEKSGQGGQPERPKWDNNSSREEPNEDLRSGERSPDNEFKDSQDQHGYDNRDRWKQ